MTAIMSVVVIVIVSGMPSQKKEILGNSLMGVIRCLPKFYRALCILFDLGEILQTSWVEREDASMWGIIQS